MLSIAWAISSMMSSSETVKENMSNSVVVPPPKFDRSLKSNMVAKELLQKERKKAAFFDNLTTIFPQLDPEFLRETANGFRDEEQMNEWITEIFENDLVDTFPSLREAETLRKLEKLVAFFPQIDPEFLHEKANEFEDENQMQEWIDEILEKNAQDSFPSRTDYEERQRETVILEKYSNLSVQEFFEIYDDDPEAYFMDKNRKVSELYEKHSWQQLKKEFCKIPSSAIKRIFKSNKGLFLPSARELQEQEHKIPKRWFKRSLEKCLVPSKIDFNFLKELQYFQKEVEIQRFLEEKASALKRKIEEERIKGTLMECSCCCNDECLVEDMLPCGGGHIFCKNCIRRASDVAIGKFQFY